MDRPMEMLMWGALLLVGYAYAGYPLVLWFWSRLGAKPLIRASITPSVSVVIAAWNEGERIARRIENCLEQDYPAGLLEVVVVSDGSMDETADIARRFPADRVRVLVLESRKGKAVALNWGVAASRGEIVVFADARQRFAPAAIRELVANFVDPGVGAVSGELMIEPSERSPSPEAVGLYWRMEKWIRAAEAAVGSVVGVTGAVYAIRRELYEALPAGTILDDLLVPMRIVMRGYRVVFERKAIARDRAARDYRSEFGRKVRTLAGNYQAVSLCPALLNPRRNPIFFQFVSHKLCRLIVPFALLALLGSSAALADQGFAPLVAAQLVGYGLGLVGWVLAKVGVRERVSNIAFTFCMLNWAALVGAFRYVRRDAELWGKAR